MSSIPEPIAIIGSGCRFPGGVTKPSELWDLIKEPKDVLSPVPEDRWNAEGFYHEDGKYHGHGNARHAYFLSGKGTHRQFDARFFGINPAEAKVLDPQIRLLLETVYESLEAAGQTIEGLQGTNTAMYVGTMLSEYERLMLRDEDTIGTYHATGTSRALVSNRVSYFFDWHGPSMTLDTACSSSLVAVHQAVQQLRTKQSRVAVAAGANLILDPQAFISFSKLGMLSVDGRSRMWDANANGYARGEGIAAIVLKTLSAAEADGDHIECIIREVGTNQDGRTPGLTMPNSSAQAKLIQDCYARAGLDLANPDDRPQFFEAHGTGTAVGDPVEAGAIHSAFFENKSGAANTFERLYVGSIKSVIGHTEGTAGLAALLKGSLAVQSGTIPPNMHFNHLNPKIKQFYGNLKVPTTQLPWPGTQITRRTSVNCFGFGGANAHAILENYKSPSNLKDIDTGLIHFAPFVFSAASRQSLFSYIMTFCDYLESQKESPFELRDLAYTLHSRRSRLQVSTTVAASSTTDLFNKLKVKLDLVKKSKDQDFGIRSVLQSSEQKPSILGVFTGQGAQWARMGADILESSTTAYQTIKSLDTRLSQLPFQDRPSWSLLDEILKDASCSRINQATFSQPICTAIQVLLVDMIYAAGIEFSAVVGHSSGEIGAAYAAGFISAEDAICIAYYRGLYSDLAEGSSGQPGAIMAVESTTEDIQELCGSRRFKGRVSIAAFNSPTSLTVSGDEDAVKELQAILQDENKFVRLLKVDKAYHSHHMLPCSQKYTTALSALNIQIRSGHDSLWFSSVDDGVIDAQTLESLRGKYWNDNLTKPVHFMQAIRAAWASIGAFDIAIEVGPHPALKNPVLQTLQSISAPKLPYTGLLHRGEDSTEAIAAGLGVAWSHIGGKYVNLQAYDAFLSGTSQPSPRLIKGLPSYVWDHETEYWHESRYPRAERGRTGPSHSLLGHLTPDSTKEIMRWRNILQSKEIPWVKGHRLQGQTVFPAAGYVVLALEAALQLCKGESVSLVEILDLQLRKALTLDNHDMPAEALFSLTDIMSEKNEQTILANFSYNASEKDNNSLSLLATGSLRITLGEICNAILPARRPGVPNLQKVQVDKFYESLEKNGYEYNGPFKAMSEMQRKLGYATGFISILEETDLVLHPAVLDTAFQSTFLARSVPFDGGIWALHVPRTIRSIRINPALCASELQQGKALSFESVQPVDTNEITGDVDIYSTSLPNALIQVQGLSCVPFAPQDAKNDKEVFATTTWDVANPDAKKIAKDFTVTPEERSLAHLLERVSIFYLKKLDGDVSSSHPARLGGPLTGLFNFASHCISLAHSGNWSFWDPNWNHDSESIIAKACEPFEDVIDVKLLRQIGQNMVAIATGEKQAIEVGMQDSLLATYYQHSLGTDTYTRFLGQTVKQIAHRYPHMKMLEIGAGTGGATKSIFREIEQAYASYTFTDVSSGFFATAQDVFDGQPRMAFKVLDINKDPREQGFKENSYDLIAASMVLHATNVLETTMCNVRRLLKPGGYLIMLEGLPDADVRFGAIFGAFPGWWAGAGDGRILSPLSNVAGWNDVLRRTGFSGCDTSTPNPDPLVAPLTVIVSQAVDHRIKLLRNPLSRESNSFLSEKLMEELIVVGSSAPNTCSLAGQVEALLAPYYKGFRAVKSIADIRPEQLSNKHSLLYLSDLDECFFRHPTSVSWEALRGLLLRVRNVLWVTHSRRSKNPHANMIVGLLRSAPRELPTLNIQFLDFADVSTVEARIIAETLLRLKEAVYWQREDSQQSLLYSIEPEIMLDYDSRAIIPRLKVNSNMNNRYNSARRTICDIVNTDSEGITVSGTDSGHIIYHQPSLTLNERSEKLCTTHSLLFAIRAASSASLFVLFGRNRDSNDQEVFLSTDLAFNASAWYKCLVPVDIEHGFEADFLSHVGHHMLASAFLERLGKDDHIIVLAGNLPFEDVLTWRARNVGVNVTFITFDLTSTKANWLKLHPAAADRDIKDLLPENISVLLDLTDASSAGLSKLRLQSMLSKGCRQETLETLFRQRSEIPRQSQVEIIRDRFRDAVNYAHYSIAETENARRNIPVVALSDLRESDGGTNRSAILDWTARKEITARLLPVDSYVKFSELKTYWLAGLSHGLGLSLCEWMVRHGAKHVVISSRRPNVNKSWLAKMFTRGASIRVYLCPIYTNALHNDVTNEIEVKKTHADIVRSMPAIGGVTHGAMVLGDVSIGEMSFEQLRNVTRPKVEGSLHLNNLFQENCLDFFVFFSSASAVVGYPGQSNYSAANLFMSALAEQRHQQGLAASVINIGPVLGIGYIAQQDIDFTARVNSGEGTFISEQDFHQLFAEAVLAGRPGAVGPIEITTGIGRLDSQSKVQTAWVSNPIMSHYIKNHDTTEDATNDTKTAVPFRTLLQQAISRDEVYGVLHEAFIVKLSALYQLPIDNLIHEDPKHLNLSEMGTDSLLATEIRGWFVRTLQVNIPVLKILSGTTIHELLIVATETIPPTWIPNVAATETHISDHPACRSYPPLPSPRALSPPLINETWQRDTDDDTSSTSDNQACETPEEEDMSGKNGTRPSSAQSELDTNEKPTKFTDEKPSGLAFQKISRLSLGQEMFWFVITFLQDKSSLNHTASFRLSGQIRHQDFEAALQSVSQQHEILRACFFEQDGKPVQAVLQSSTIRGEYRDIQHVDELPTYVKELEQHSFDIAHGETLKVFLLSLSPTTHFLIMCAHSLVVDGLSFRIFLSDLQQYYTHAQQPRETPQYLDFARAQHLNYETGQYAEELRYWRSEFSSFPDPLPVLSLGKNSSRPALTSFENVRSDIRLGAETKDRIRTLCRQNGVTPFHFHLTVFRALLARYTDVEDISIGIGDANRTDEDMMKSIGPFVNLLPLRFQTQRASRFDKLLKETRLKTLAALENSKVPFQVLLNELGAPRSATCTPIFQCFVDYRLGQKENMSWANCQLEMLSFQVSKLAYDIALDIIDDSEGDCVAMLIVRKDLYSQEDAQYLIQSYERLVNAFVTDLSMPLDEPEIFSASDIERAVGFGRGPSRRRVWPETAVHRIDDIIQQRSNKIAIKWDNDKVATYSDIKARINTIAKSIQAANIPFGSRIATLLEPTDIWISSILAIQRLGAAYMPLDQGNSWSRLAVILRDASPSLLLVDNDTEQFVPKFCPAEVRVINVSRLVIGSDPSVPISATSDGLATVLYTSGSSGTPKGILLRHEGFHNWLENTAEVYDIDAEVVLQQSSPGFDMSLIQILTALCLGGSLYLVPRRLRGDARAISELIHSQSITYTFTCTSELFTWFRYGDSTLLAQSEWRRAITGGEPGVDKLFTDFASLKKPDLRMFHAYGPTEISWTATTMELLYNNMTDNSCLQNVAVGYPLPNYTVFILDKEMNAVPPGVQGEIFIGGPGVATGYINNDALSKERFVPDVFATSEYRRRGWKTLHRTGDLGRWGETGALFIEGRMSGDTQIKLRGLRIDLQDVERALINASDGALSEAVVSLSPGSLEKPQFLVAHVVFDQSKPEVDRSRLLDALPARLGLPRYMCPSAIIPLDQMPLTSSLKLDRRSIAMLPLPEIADTQSAELSETESNIKTLWEDVLPRNIANLHNIKPATDFFHIGGTSLLLLDLRSHLQARFEIQISLIQLFDASTLAGMALLVENKGAQHSSRISIDWDNETNLTSALLKSPTGVGRIRYSEPKTVVLTGSTGYLGQGILSALIRDRDINQIYCIAVRNARNREAIYRHKKITVYEGDLTNPRLGLSVTEVDDIFESADVIIHNGADVSYMKTYASLRLPNLEATKRLAEMSLRRRIPFHYISSGGACSFAGAAGCQNIGPASVTRFPPPPDGQLGYASSKWASEVFLEKLAAHHKDWPIWIHRPSNIARIDKPQLDLVHNLQQYSRLLKAVPIARGKVQGTLNSVTLDAVVEGVLVTIKGMVRENNKSGVRFLHHLGGVKLPMHDLRSWICNTDELSMKDIEEIPFEEWNSRAAAKGMNAALIAFLQMFASQGGFTFPRLVKSGGIASLD